MSENPKLAGSHLIDCIPQIGKCQNQCAECFYNRAFYRPLDTPLLPTLEEAEGKIVRVNSGHDSNIDHEHVMATTSRYPFKFYNTSIPEFAFPAPVVFTCNGREPLFVTCPPNVMFVRVRYNPWDLMEQDALVGHYLAQGVAVVLTWMRYYSIDAIPPAFRDQYEHGKHLVNEYWKLRPESKVQLARIYAGMGVRQCGLPWSSLCADCRNCELLYCETARHLGLPVPDLRVAVREEAEDAK